MLSKSAARSFFLIGTGLCAGTFLLLTVDTISQFGERTNTDQLSPSAKRGFEIWTDNNCMGCHTLLGEGAYYAPELTRVVERRGAGWIKSFLQNPAMLYPGRRQMVKYSFFDPKLDKNAEQNMDDVIAFFSWVQQIDTNGFPPAPDIIPAGSSTVAVNKEALVGAPITFKTICVGCHQLGGQGGKVGPALDGVGKRLDAAFLTRWIKDPQTVKPGTAMPRLTLSDQQVAEVVEFLGRQK